MLAGTRENCPIHYMTSIVLPKSLLSASLKSASIERLLVISHMAPLLRILE